MSEGRRRHERIPIPWVLAIETDWLQIDELEHVNRDSRVIYPRHTHVCPGISSGHTGTFMISTFRLEGSSRTIRSF
jgi:hypothetical protein